MNICSTKHASFESSARTIVGFAFWIIEGLITASLYVSIANGDPFKTILMVVLAIALEFVKVFAWHSDQQSARILAIGLIV